jgi:WD40 repeat protein
MKRSSSKELAVLKGHTGGVGPIVFSPDGRVLASGSFDKTIKLWDVNARKELATFKGHRSDVWTVEFDSDGKTLYSSCRDGNISWEVKTGKVLRGMSEFESTRLPRSSLSPESNLLARALFDKTIELKDMLTGKWLSPLKGHTDVVNSVAFSPDGKTLASGSDDKTIKLWEVSLKK